MGANHPVSFCKDFQGGRSFYTALGTAAGSFDAQLREHLKGAISWAAGQSDPAYSDCGATVLKNFQQVKVSAPPNLNEPIGFDQLPDGRIIQTARRGELRLHDPVKGTTQIIADFSSTSLPTTQRIYTHSEDGLYGPAVDNDFATNHWVYLYYAPQTVTNVKLSDGSIVTQTTPNTTPPSSAASKSAWDPYVGYFQLSRFKFIDGDGTNPPKLDLSSEEQILRVSNNRQQCCHVAGDIDFDSHNNLWFVTGDDNEANGINGGGYGPMNDQLTDEQQVLRATNATGGTFTLSFKGQTTAALPFNATAAQVDTALEALSTVGTDNVQTSGGPVNTANLNVFFRRSLQQADQDQITANAAGLTGGSTPTFAATTQQQGGWFQNPIGDTRRGAANTNDLRGKVNRIKVSGGTIAAADQNKADFGSGGAYTIPAGNLFPLQGGQPQAKTRPEVYAMGFRNPYRLQVDKDDVAYVTDYSPDAQAPQRGRGPAGTGRVEIVRKPSNYGWPMCYSKTLSYYKWSYSEFVPNTNPPVVGVPLNNPPQKWDCSGASVRNESKWVRDGGPANEPGLADLPPVTDPDIWYSYRDNPSAAVPQPLGTPCAAYADPTPGPIAPGSTTECPRLFPELYSGLQQVGPHGAAKYDYNPANPNAAKFPPYWDNSIILGEFTQDTLREIKTDSQNRIFKINQALDCGAVAGFGGVASAPFEFECDNPEDLQWGADGNLYLLTYGDGFFAINGDAGMYKWEYVKGQRSPKAVITTNKTDGALPLTVQFTGSGSSDPDPGDSIRYEWDFGDGSPISEEANPSHVYTKAGRYTAALTVTDSSGKKTATSTVITAGNTSPTVTVEAPIHGGLFSFGDVISYKVTVTDPDEPTIDCKDVVTTFVLGHDSHGHAENSATGCSGFLETIPDDINHGGNVFGVISATYADKGAPGAPSLETTSQVQIRQKHTEVEFVVNQSGTATATNADGAAGVHRSSLGAGEWLQLNGPLNLHQINTLAFRVADASAGRTAGSPLAAIEVRADSITGPIVTTANLVSTGGTGTWSTQTFPISLTGTHELFFVFRAVTGGATGNNLFNLNWAEFGGNGVTTVQTNTPGDVGGSVPATLSLSLGAPATFGAFTPGVAKTYTAKTTANVISTAGDATLSVSDPGHLTNGTFSLPQPLQVAFSKSTWTGPTSNENVDITFNQDIGATDALRTGAYSKTVTFTLSTTQP
jgi:PKD repeat protein/glucose/arabinose dehydrogenase